MKPSDAVTRLLQLGASIRINDFPRIERVHISETAMPLKYVDTISDMLPEIVMLDGSLMTENDVEAILHFPSLRGIVAHRMDFANALLRELSASKRLATIAMSYTSLTDADVAMLENHSGITSINFSGTQLTNVALETFGTLKSLEVLDLRGTFVTDEGLTQLQKLTNLFTIDVQGTAVTLNGADRFRKSVEHSLPDVEVLIGSSG